MCQSVVDGSVDFLHTSVSSYDKTYHHDILKYNQKEVLSSK